MTGKLRKNFIDNRDERYDEVNIYDLQNNPDYIALSSALSLLERQKARAQQDIVKLQRLKAEALGGSGRIQAQFG